MDDFDADVIVVGAGPTGLMLAAELRLAGATAVVVERLTEPMRQSRALGFSARTIEEFGQRGLLPRFGELDVIPVGHFGGIPLDYRVLQGGSYGARGKPQSLTESVLGGWAAELGAVVHRGTELTGLRQSPEGVEVELSQSGATRRMRARYVVGCDGARSAVRRLAGIDFPGTRPEVEMWLADVAGVPLRMRFSGERVPGGMVMVLPLGAGACRVAVYDAAAEPAGRAPTFTEVADTFRRLTGEDISGGRPLWVSWFTDSSRQAASYRRGRVLLAGDAAHIHLPIGAQGMSAGIQDAVNLGWKLAAELRGDAPDGLLDTYHSERHPVGARIIANTLAQRILYLSGGELDPLREVFTELLGYPEVQRHLAGMVTGLDIRHDVGPGTHPLLGRRLPDADLLAGDRKTTTYELLAAGRAVLLDLGDDRALRDEAAGWADRVETVTATRPDAADHSHALLVRPDGYVAWAGPGAGAPPLSAALGRWFGAPRRSS
jgi:2-polyprenyl-6-methoxyphenol hydroxylase-like FAD-dependent oxidoreductase